MTDREIQFRAPMIRALLDGRKTQTRLLAWRVIEGNDLMKPPGSPLSGKGFRGDDLISADIDGTFGFRATKWQKVKPGDRLWVQESIRTPPPITTKMRRDGADTWPTVMYDTDLDTIDRDWCKEHDWKSLPSIHMPRWASRLTLIVTAVRFERLREISAEDAMAEGLETFKAPNGHLTYGIKDSFGGQTPTEAFRILWETIHDADYWNANPEVIAISFDVVKENIDKLRTDVSDLVRAS